MGTMASIKGKKKTYENGTHTDLSVNIKFPKSKLMTLWTRSRRSFDLSLINWHFRSIRRSEDFLTFDMWLAIRWTFSFKNFLLIWTALLNHADQICNILEVIIIIMNEIVLIFLKCSIWPAGLMRSLNAPF